MKRRSALHVGTVRPKLFTAHTAKFFGTKFGALPEGYLFPCSAEINRFLPLFPKIKTVIFYVPCFPKLHMFLCSPDAETFVPCTPEIKSNVPLFAKTPGRASR